MKSSTGLVLIGVLALAGGILALVNPFAASISVEIFLGWLFLISGAFGLASAFRMSGDRLWPFLSALAMFVIGVFMIANPLAGLMALTVLIAVAFLFSGVVRLFMARVLRDTSAFWMILFSGAVSILLAGMIFAGYPSSSESILGLFLGIELIMAGIPMILLGLNLRNG
ncbi:HdeD family acid-resistance protein [Aliiroseovarius sp. 2305UL8-7]|uniref:HdeD family acid-resistance protein n=1 Tax=Aliiroseovarius conchicola TaxID=3121637 RepID=UPI0035299308